MRLNFLLVFTVCKFFATLYADTEAEFLADLRNGKTIDISLEKGAGPTVPQPFHDAISAAGYHISNQNETYVNYIKGNDVKNSCQFSQVTGITITNHKGIQIMDWSATSQNDTCSLAFLKSGLILN